MSDIEERLRQPLPHPADHLTRWTDEELLLEEGANEIARLEALVEDMQLQQDQTLQTLAYLWKWVERGMFDKQTAPMTAIGCLAFHPSAPWQNGRWDVDHKPYAEQLYAKFPKARAPSSGLKDETE